MGGSREADGRAAWDAITRMFIGDENQRRFQQIAEQLGVTVRLLHAVLDLSPDEPVAMGALARDWCCDASNVTSIVDGLEERGLARRETSSSDRRVKLVRLTNRGVGVRDQARERLLRPPSGLMALSAAELRTLRTLLTKAAATYEWPAAADRACRSPGDDPL